MGEASAGREPGPYAHVIRHSVEDGGFIATVPSLPGCSAFGTTAEEAGRQIEPAIEAWLAACRAAGNPIPAPDTPRTTAQETPMDPALSNLLDGLRESVIVLRANAYEYRARSVEKAIEELTRLNAPAAPDAEEDAARDALRRIREWCEAYPLKVFPDQDLMRADAVLKEAGISMSAMHGQWARHIVEGIAGIAGAKPDRETFGG